MKNNVKVLLICLLQFFLCFSNAQTNAPKTDYTSENYSNYVDLTAAAEQAVPAVVHIKTEFRTKNSAWDDYYSGSFWEDFFGLHRNNDYPVIAAGSGVIISSDGYIITNNHVVDGAEKITITLNDKHEYQGTLIGTDADADLAVVKIEGEHFPYLSFGNSDAVRLGEWVLAVGNPFNLTSTVTAGIVSAKARNLNILGESSSIESFIQTDAAVNQGNSGGALVNNKGELIGINSAIASGTGYFTGYSFAIPSNVAFKVSKDLIQYGCVQRAFIGLSIKDIDAQTAAEMNLSDLNGVLVALIDDNGAAKQHGIKEGDIIISIDDAKVNSMSELREILMQHSPGDHVKVTFLRNEETFSKNIQLLNRKGNNEIIRKEDINPENILGANFSNISKREMSYYRITGGVKVTNIEEGIFKNSGIRKGFIITAINGNIIADINDLDKFILTHQGQYVAIEGVYDNGFYKYTYSLQLP